MTSANSPLATADCRLRKGVVVVVLESMAWDRAAGRLPHLDALRQQSLFVEVDTPSEISSGTAWSTFNTGTRAGRHGMGFFHRQLRSGTYDLVKRYADEVHGEPFWNALSRAGRRVGVFDASLCHPPDPLHGVMLVRWGDEHPSWHPDSRPAGLLEEVRARFGRHPLDGWYQERVEDWNALTTALETAAATRARIAEHLWDRGPFDLFVVNFAEPHWAGHMMWHLSDPTHPDHDPRFGDPLHRVYQACDEALGRLLSRFEEHPLLVASLSGMGPAGSGDALTPEILKRGGFGGTGGVSVAQVESVVPGRVLNRLKALFPERLWEAWTRKALGLRHGRDRTLAFQVPGDQTTLLRLNLQGREPKGRVAPHDYDATCHRLTSLFRDLVDPATGRPAVAEVVRVREKYPGPRVDDLPDLVVIWRDDRCLRAVTSPAVGRLEVPAGPKRSGSHRQESFLLARGPGFPAGGTARASLEDLAPTVLHLLGEPVPPEMDGKPLQACETPA